MNEEELEEEIIQERIGAYFKHNMDRSNEQVKRNEEFLSILSQKCPDLHDDFCDYFKWYTNSIDEEYRGIYIHGVRDGILLKNKLKL